MRALRQLEYGQDLQVCEVPVPKADAGTVVVRILAAGVISYTKQVYNGTLKYPYPTPITTGLMGVGRVHEVSSDCVDLEKGQLVVFDPVLRSPYTPSDSCLVGFHEGMTDGSRRLMASWRDGSNAEYMECLYQNLFPLSEELLKSPDVGGLGYSVNDLLYIGKAMVPYGGFSSIDLRPGETVIVAPATGGFGGAAVRVALAMGARVIALGRNQKVLAELKDKLEDKFPRRLITVPILDNVDEQVKAIKKACGPLPIDCFFDIGPTNVSEAAYFKACFLALRYSGRVSLMGGHGGYDSLPLRWIMRQHLTLQGQWMYEPEDTRRFIRMVESGTILLGEHGGISPVRQFELEDWKEAFDCAEKHANANGEVAFRIGSD